MLARWGLRGIGRPDDAVRIRSIRIFDRRLQHRTVLVGKRHLVLVRCGFELRAVGFHRAGRTATVPTRECVRVLLRTRHRRLAPRVSRLRLAFEVRLACKFGAVAIEPPHRANPRKARHKLTAALSFERVFRVSAHHGDALAADPFPLHERPAFVGRGLHLNGLALFVRAAARDQAPFARIRLHGDGEAVVLATRDDELDHLVILATAATCVGLPRIA